MEKEISTYDKILFGIMTVMFVLSFYASSFIVYSVVTNKIALFAFGLMSITINLTMFKLTFGMFYKYSLDDDSRRVNIYYTSVIALSLALVVFALFTDSVVSSSSLAVVMFEFVYFILVCVYRYYIVKNFGKYNLIINKSNKKNIPLQNISSSNCDMVVIRNGKPARSNSYLKEGDSIILSVKNKKLLTLKVEENEI